MARSTDATVPAPSKPRPSPAPASFHGDAYEFVRNDVFNATPAVPDQRNPSYKKNDLGYTIGGPVYIPGHYNKDKHKTFFFWSQEWRRDRVPGQNFNVIVPSVAERGGNFSDLCPGAGLPVQPAMIDRVANPNKGNPFPGNQVPVDPTSAPLLGHDSFAHSRDESSTRQRPRSPPIGAKNWFASITTSTTGCVPCSATPTTPGRQ